MSLALLPADVARADGAAGVIIFAVVYIIVTILGKAKQAGQKQQQEQQQQQQQARQQRRLNQQRQQRPKPRPEPPQSRPSGDTQAEAVKLQELLRVLGEAAGVPTTQGPMGRPSAPLPSAEEVEERESLEVEEEIQNLETSERRPLRREVDFDDEAEQIVQRRIRAAAERDRALAKVDHQEFDSRIRAVPDATRVARPRLDAIRKAIVWREILGPPISLRHPSDSDL